MLNDHRHPFLRHSQVTTIHANCCFYQSLVARASLASKILRMSNTLVSNEKIRWHARVHGIHGYGAHVIHPHPLPASLEKSWMQQVLHTLRPAGMQDRSLLQASINFQKGLFSRKRQWCGHRIMGQQCASCTIPTRPPEWYLAGLRTAYA
jgi:hypothetical protein